jgi:hypothetical protein
MHKGTQRHVIHATESGVLENAELIALQSSVLRCPGEDSFG